MSEREPRQAPQDLAADHDQPEPGDQSPMRPQPDTDRSNCRAAGKHSGEVAPITGDDSGAGRTIAMGGAFRSVDWPRATGHHHAAGNHRLPEPCPANHQENCT